MNPILKNIIAVVLGLLLGSAANMLTLQIGMALIPPPEGFDMNTPAGLESFYAAAETKHFITPFLSHALGDANWCFCCSAHSGQSS